MWTGWAFSSPDILSFTLLRKSCAYVVGDVSSEFLEGGREREGGRGREREREREGEGREGERGREEERS